MGERRPLGEMHEAFEAAWRGELEPRDGLVEQLAESAHDADRAWALALRAHRYHAGLEPVPPSLMDVGAFVGASVAAREAATLAASLLGRACVLAFDRPGLDAVVELLDALSPGLTDERATLSGEATRMWRDVLDGGGAELMPRLDVLSNDASRARFGELVIEASVLRTAATLDARDLDEATRHARRVSRMARTEGMPQQEYLAHLFLARIRRHAGHAPLATRILTTLHKVAPPAWWPWLGWELRAAGHAMPEGSGGPGALAEQLIAAFIAGDSDVVNDRARSLRACVAGFSSIAREVSLLIGALDPRIAAESLDPALGAWARGAAPTLPDGLHSVVAAVPSPHTELAGHSWVLATPRTTARRFLHPGIGVLTHIPLTQQTRRRHGRTELATAVLALAGPAGVPVSEFVPEVYGFAYSHDAHDGVLRVLLHRMRKNLEGLATVDRVDEHLTLTVTAPFLVPDPRTSEPAGERILRMVAANPGASAKDIAAALGVPLRTVQGALADLVADGSCLAERKGAAVEYRLEDTTFSEPTSTHALDKRILDDR